MDDGNNRGEERKWKPLTVFPLLRSTPGRYPMYIKLLLTVPTDLGFVNGLPRKPPLPQWMTGQKSENPWNWFLKPNEASLVPTREKKKVGVLKGNHQSQHLSGRFPKKAHSCRCFYEAGVARFVGVPSSSPTTGEYGALGVRPRCYFYWQRDDPGGFDTIRAKFCPWGECFISLGWLSLFRVGYY